jgi:hypothetical protein
MRTPPDFHELIPELRDWEETNGRPFDPEDWITSAGSFEHAIGYACFFWPKFVIFDDCVLGEGFSKDAYAGFLRSSPGDKTAVEHTINHIHLSHLFPAQEKRPTKAQILFLGNRLREFWSCKLARDFPDRKIEVVFNGDEDCEDLHDYYITAYQVRNES